MIITKKAIPRRTVLRGIGATLALPLLDGMVPALSALARTAANPSQRFTFIYVPHGSIMKQWTPAQEGAGFEFSPILKPLEPFREQVNVLTGLSSTGENGHSVSTAMWLSGTFPSKGSVLRLGTTIDQIIAQKDRTGHDVPLDGVRDGGSLQPPGELRRRFPLLVHEHDLLAHANAAAADGDQPSRRLRADVRRRGAPRAKERLARLEQNSSILDGVAESVRDLERGLGSRDRVKLAEYLDNVREIERRILQAEKQRDEAGVEVPPTPVGVPEAWEEHVALMFELQALAFQANLTAS